MEQLAEYRKKQSEKFLIDKKKRQEEAPKLDPPLHNPRYKGVSFE